MSSTKIINRQSIDNVISIAVTFIIHCPHRSYSCREAGLLVLQMLAAYTAAEKHLLDT